MRSQYWQKLQNQSRFTPQPREGHSFLYSARLRKWILFGGLSTSRSNEVLLYDPVPRTWTQLETQGKPPAERCYHAAWIDDNRNVLYIFGGQGDRREPLSDMHAFHLEHQRWTRFQTQEQPGGRAHAAVSVVGDRVLLFGGASSDSILQNDLWSFPFSQVDWSIASSEIRTMNWQQHRTKGTLPAGRKGHSISFYEERIVLFGGITDRGSSNEISLLSLRDFRWNRAQPVGAGPSPRAFHSADVLPNGTLVIFGGIESIREGKTERINILNDIFILDIEDLQWTRPKIGAQAPSRRYGHAMAWGINQQSRSQILIVGGLEQTYAGMDVFSIEESEISSSASWRGETTSKRPRKRQDSAIVGELIEGLEKDVDMLSNKLEEERHKARFEYSVISDKIDSLQKEKIQKKAHTDHLMRLVKLNHDKNQVLQERNEKLEDILKKAESLLIMLDHNFNELIQANVGHYTKMLPQVKFDEISARKEKHQDALVNIRGTYESSIKQLQQIDSDIERQEIELSKRETTPTVQEDLHDSLEEEDL